MLITRMNPWISIEPTRAVGLALDFCGKQAVTT
jgi:hypothetical protein